MLIEIADSRFQQELLEEAQRAGKIDRRYRIPDPWRSNRPERLEAVLAPYRARHLFQPFPFGTDLTDEEVVLKRALERLKWMATHKRPSRLRISQFAKVTIVPEGARRYLERMGLEAPRTLKQRVLQRALVYALASIDAI
jgi:hypothetical protein